MLINLNNNYLETYYHLIDTLEKNLKELESTTSDLHTLSGQSIIFCKKTLHQLKSYREQNPFKDNLDEIEFYKHVKPRVLSHLIYYIKRLNIESKRPKAGTKEQIKYLKKYITKLQNYFNNNLEFYHYYKSCSNHLDEQYFLHMNKTVRLNIEAYHFFTDEQFSASHDTSVATIMAFTRLIEYLKNEIDKLEKPHHHMETVSPFQKASRLNWTGSKTDLVELIYALYSSGAINNGNVEIKDIALNFQAVLNIDLGNYYHSFVEMRTRKINQTKFLDKLKEKLLNYIHTLDALN